MEMKSQVKGRWSEIFPHFGIKYEVGNKHRECPICSKKKFRMDDKGGTGSWICVCGAGQGFKLIHEVTSLDYASIYRECAKILGLNTERPRPKPANLELQQAISDFRSAKTVPGTEGETYLNNRGIWVKPQGGVKFSESIHDRQYGKMKGLFAIASNEFGEAIYRHVTYISDGLKANVDKQKKMLKLQDYDGSVAIKLFKHQTTLGVSEGIETSLAVMQQFKCPTWATLNATLLKKFRAPAGVTHLIIWADNDRGGTGLAAAFECGRANVYANNDVRRVTIKWTQNRGDFADYILEPSTINEFPLSK